MDVVRAVTTVFGTKYEREMKKILPIVHKINEMEPSIQKMSDFRLRDQTRRLRERLSRGATLDDILVEAFATAREAAVRAVGMRPFDVQLIGAIILHNGTIAEMKTGEGKTLVAALPLYLNALAGRGCHLVTVNDYLAKRDAEWMGQIYRFLGMTVGNIVHGLTDRQRQQAYRSDITYGTNHEFGFDYLRDNMKDSIEQYVHRLLPENERPEKNKLFNYCIVDEVDSVLIDEARTPLIISGPAEEAADLYLKVNEVVRGLKRDVDFTVDEKAHSVNLTDQGVERVERRLRIGNLYDPRNLDWLHHVNQALRAHNLYKRDVNYLVEEGKVVIVDEHTGRKLPGRRWSDGLHQAVEAKEGLKPEEENQTLATVTYQNYFRMYKKLAGMTGTAETEAEEFHKIYKLDVMVIPTNVPCVRLDHDDVIYKTEEGKLQAVIEEIIGAQKRGQPTLVGTISVEKTEEISKRLRRKKIKHEVLNAKNHGREATIVAQAGAGGSVTIATNMAGRGTDIILGGNPDFLSEMEADPESEPEKFEKVHERFQKQCAEDKKRVLAAGGLHILGTERHEARRIDNQLRGRAGRQGDPGTSRFYLSLEDDLMRIFGGDRLNRIMEWARMPEDVPIEHPWVNKSIERAQKQVEGHNFDIRKNLLEYDNVMNHQRLAVYSLRRQVLEGRYVPELSETEIKAGKRGKAPTESGKWTVELLSDKVRPWVTRLIDKVYEEEASGLPSPETLTHLLYRYFGAKVELDEEVKDADACKEKATREVAASLIQQRERLLDLAYDLVGKQVEIYCPPDKHLDDWDQPAMEDAVYKIFDIYVDGLEWLANRKEIETAVQQIYKVSGNRVSKTRLENIIRELIDEHMPLDLEPDEWDFEKMNKALSGELGIKKSRLEEDYSRENVEEELMDLIIGQQDPDELRARITKEVKKLSGRLKQYGTDLLGADFDGWLEAEIDEYCPVDESPDSWELDLLAQEIRNRLNRPEDGITYISEANAVADRVYEEVERFVALADQMDDLAVSSEATPRFLREYCPQWDIEKLREDAENRLGIKLDLEEKAHRTEVFSDLYRKAAKKLERQRILSRFRQLIHEELSERLGVQPPEDLDSRLEALMDKHLPTEVPIDKWNHTKLFKEIVFWLSGETVEEEVDMRSAEILHHFLPVGKHHITMERFLETAESLILKACPSEEPMTQWDLDALAKNVREAFFVWVEGLEGKLDSDHLKELCVQRAVSQKEEIRNLVAKHCPPDVPIGRWEIKKLIEAADALGEDISEAAWVADHQQLQKHIDQTIVQAAQKREGWRHPEKLPTLLNELMSIFCPSWDIAGLIKELERRTKKNLNMSLDVPENRDVLAENMKSALEEADLSQDRIQEYLESTLPRFCPKWNQIGLQESVSDSLGTRIELKTVDPSAPKNTLFEAIEKKVLSAQTLKELTDWQKEVVSKAVDHHYYGDDPPRWDKVGLIDALEEIFCERFEDIIKLETHMEINKRLLGIALSHVAGWDKGLSLERRLWVFRHLYLEEIDDQWIEHLKAMDHLREGIGLRGYGQRDPKLEYQREGFAMFEAMMQRIQENVSSKVFRVRIEEEDDELPEFEHKRRQMQFLHRSASTTGGGGGQQSAPERPKTVRRKVRKVGPNEPCPCGSGQKYKKCHMQKDKAAARRGELPSWAMGEDEGQGAGKKKKSAGN